MFRMGLFLGVILSAFFGSKAQGLQSFFGTVKRNPDANQICVYINDGSINNGSINKKYLLRSLYQSVTYQLSKLEDGDVVVGMGEIKPIYNVEPAGFDFPLDMIKTHFYESQIDVSNVRAKETLILSQIDFVGVQKLLGAWRGKKDKSILLHFESFDKVNFFYNNNSQWSEKQMRYSLSPSEDGGWKIFISHASQVVLGAIHIYQSDVKIYWLDIEPSLAYLPNTPLELQRY